LPTRESLLFFDCFPANPAPRETLILAASGPDELQSTPAPQSDDSASKAPLATRKKAGAGSAGSIEPIVLSGDLTDGQVALRDEYGVVLVCQRS
jgi:hypothetical protein